MVKNKLGFSLLEACVVMLMAAIFIAMSASAFSKRNLTHIESDGHGRYECYRNAGGAIQQRYVENNSVRNVSGASCTFRPPRYAKYLLINAVGAGSATGAGVFQSVFFSSVDQTLTITPGQNGGSTIIEMPVRSTPSSPATNETIVSVPGGSGGSSVLSSNTDTVSKCEVTSNPKNCGSTPQCGQSGKNIVISYCRTENDYITRQVPITQVKNCRASLLGNVITYRDLSEYEAHGVTPEDAKNQLDLGAYESNYTIKVTFETTGAATSSMTNYIKGLGITDGIANVSPGEIGKPGGVVILW